MSQRDEYVAVLVGKVGWNYCNDGPWRCTGTRGCYDCSGFLCWGLNVVGVPYPCLNTDSMAADMRRAQTTITRDECRATPGTWAIRLIDNPTFPGDGHMVCSLGDGRTVEAHSHVDGVIVGTFDGDRGFQVYGRPPGLQGFDAPPPTVPVVIPPPSTTTFSEDQVPTQIEKSVQLDSHGNGVFDVNGLKARYVRSLMVTGTVDPFTVHAYSPIPRLGLTISPAGFTRVVIEGGVPSGSASVRIIHD